MAKTERFCYFVIAIACFAFIAQWGITGSVSPPATTWFNYPTKNDVDDDQGNTIYDYSNQDIADGVLTDSDIDHGLISNVNSSNHHTRPSAGTLLTENSNNFNVDESSIDHGSITGQSDDDHTQYFEVNGSDALTGPLEFQDGTTQSTSPENCASGEALNTNGCESFSSSGGDTTITVFDSGSLVGDFSELDLGDNLTVTDNGGDSATVDASGSSGGDTDTRVFTFRLTEIGPGENNQQIYVTNNDTETLVRAGIVNKNLSTGSSVLSIKDQFGDTITSNINSTAVNKNAKMGPSSFYIFELRNDSAGTEYISAYLEVQ